MASSTADFTHDIQQAVACLEQYPDNATEMRIVYMDALLSWYRRWYNLKVVGSSKLQRSILIANRSARSPQDDKDSTSTSDETLIILPVAASDYWSTESLRDTLRTISDITNSDISSFNLWLAIVATDCTVVYYQVDEPSVMYPEDMMSTSIEK
ncbi:hypothetical protein BDF22DRAFT_772798 [Syncephalis plumigaleata]|nr:hypothetical protein BDF22DRAFT_772798 [Syncephalis plumigaleata]